MYLRAGDGASGLQVEVYLRAADGASGLQVEVYLRAGDGASTLGTVHSASISGEWCPLMSWRR